MDFFDFSGVKDATEYSLIPEGDYHVVVVDQQWGHSQQGNRKLEFLVRVLTGEHSGAEILDTVTFTEKGTSRAKFVFSRLGDLDVSGVVAGSAVQLVGKQAIAKVAIEKASDPRYSDKNKVAFTGYSRPDGFHYLPWGGGNGGGTSNGNGAGKHGATPPPPPPPPPPVQPVQISPDGAWKLVNNEWVPNTAPAPTLVSKDRDDGLPF